MKIEEMLKQQEKRGLKQNAIKAKMQSYDDYVKDDSSPRPYNTSNVLDLFRDEISDIRDTNSISISDAIGDTKNIPRPDPIRDTETSLGSGFIRDTNSFSISDAIGDTKNIPCPAPIGNTETSLGSGFIRDTNGLSISDAIGDTKNIPCPDPIRDTINLEKNLHIGRPNKGNKYCYSDLSGNAKKLVNEIAYRCVVIGGLTTTNINKMDFSKNTGVKLGAIKTTIIRLKEKGVITYYEATKGRNSCWKFVLSSEILAQYVMIFRGE